MSIVPQQQILDQFPILKRKINGHRLAYLDSAATTLKPKPVIEAIRHYYEYGTSNIHRGVHTLAEEATTLYEQSRDGIAHFIGAADSAEIIFTSGTTAGINLLALNMAPRYVKRGDAVLITEMEHHADIVPWQMLCERVGARLLVARLLDDGSLDLADFKAKLQDGVKICSFVAISNALGTVNPVREMLAAAKNAGAITIVDAAQYIQHYPLSVQELGCDFMVFSGHKIYGPTGIGVLYGRRELLELVPPLFGGGDMIDKVSFVTGTTYAALPSRLEAGTPHIEGVIGLGAAIKYVQDISFESIQTYENDVFKYAVAQLSAMPEVQILGSAAVKSCLLPFVVTGIHSHDLGTILDQEGVCVRTGHHCAQPVVQRFGVLATTRASFALYSTRQDIDQLVVGLKKALTLFGE